MKIDTKDFRVGPRENVKLKKWPTHVKPYYDPKGSIKSSCKNTLQS